MSREAPALPRKLFGAKPAPFPIFIAPCLARLSSKVPAGAGFVHELKLDGYRVQAHLRNGRVMLFTRSGLNCSNSFPSVAADVARLAAGDLIIDGEVISADTNGHPNFSALQDDLKRGRYDRMVYYAFDLLHLDGFDTRPAPLVARKSVLQSILSEAGAMAPHVLYSEHFEDGVDLYARANRMNLEGIVSKRFDAPYRSGRRGQWFKVKCLKHGRFAIVGFVPEGSNGILKLRLARREGTALVYVGRVGTGWGRQIGREIRRALDPLARSTSPLSKPLKKADTTWVEPLFDAEIDYVEITDDGMVRHPSFKRLVP
jgi:bifunctional non-homologous end joining protein LigD